MNRTKFGWEGIILFTLWLAFVVFLIVYGTSAKAQTEYVPNRYTPGKYGLASAHPIRKVAVKRLIATKSWQVVYGGVLEVQELHNEAEGVTDPGFYFNRTWSDYWKHLKYLTLDGHKLPKSWTVIEIDVLRDALAVPPPETGWTQTGIASDTILSRPWSTGATRTIMDTVAEIGTWNHTTWASTDNLVDSAKAANIAWLEICRDITGNMGVRYAGGLIWLDYHWFPRRLRKRFEKYFHLGKYAKR